MFQQSTPSAVYPTPPPPGISSSSSSLAFALGQPPPKPAPRVYRVEDSPQYFADFLSRQTSGLNAPVASTSQSVQQDVTSRWAAKVLDESGELQVPTPITPHSRKRKAAQALDLSTLKHSPSSSHLGESIPARCGSTAISASSDSNDSAAPRKKMHPFVELPPIPKIYQTPNSHRTEQKREARTPQKSGIKRGVADVESRGFGSEDESPCKGVKSSGALFRLSVQSSTKQHGSAVDQT